MISPKEKAKVESLQHELLDQMFMFNIKIDQEQLAFQELNEDYKRLQDEGQNDRESFQKTVESLQKSLQDKANLLKEKEESNSILRKEAMDLVARYVILPTYQDGLYTLIFELVLIPYIPKPQWIKLMIFLMIWISQYVKATRYVML